MKRTVLPVLLVGLLLMGGSPVFAQVQPAGKPAPESQEKTESCSKIKTSRHNPNPDYAVSINGKQNTVKIGSADAITQTPASPAVETTDKNTVEINGEGNSVSISQETTGKVAVKQNGKNNQVNISQKTSNP